ncbi:hypothetical protein C8J56DRAFT_890158 [Mycena floridula]|nr:hypothetical protein C8J56DRAFT_890158 [Mycena floridula]
MLMLKAQQWSVPWLLILFLLMLTTTTRPINITRITLNISLTNYVHLGNVAYHPLKKGDSSEKVRSSAKTKLEGWQAAEPAPGAAPSSIEGNISNHLDSILQTP